ncbi:SNARE-like domain protein [Gleimia coleocanis DSM 15436]|uniref:SNARE-like domain protein n=1 Tax=Gleimia coleocanis DSM 15436 TaxID=525245 RepID=C0W218_9ACTO|nr:VTT domain-containing protein [Gleimia coleocanis]EEH63232.1 SNARE-like domain protein [Gleimia coleocanis DSM 15436]
MDAAAADPIWFETILEWFKNPETLLLALGQWVLAGVAAIVFIESGVLFPVLPGDSLVFSAGLLHTQLGLSLIVLVATIVVCALAGSEVGYWIGAKFGRNLFSDDARILKTEHLVQAENFFARYGGRSLVMGRFVPFVRTFVPIAAGIAGYNHASFLLWNLVGAVAWGGGLTLLGSLLGGVSFIHDNLSAIILVIVFVSLLPMVIEYFLHKRRNAKNPEA